MRARALGGKARLDSAGPEDQRRQIERQYDQASPARPAGARRGSEPRRSRRPGSSPGCRAAGPGSGTGSAAGSRSTNSASSGLTTTSGSPVVSQWAAALASTANSSGIADKRDQVEAAIGIIGREQPVEAQHGGEQRRDPDDPGGDAPQQLRLRADPERKQHDGEHKEAEHEADIAALAQRQAADRGGSDRGRRPSALASRIGWRRKSSSASVVAPGIASGWCVATATRPPAARCAAIAAARRASPSSSSAAPGSSSSQIGAGAAISRARASRRRWPADSQRHGPVGDRLEAEGGERRVDGGMRHAAQRRPEAEHLARAQRRLHPVEMADIMDCGAIPRRILARPARRPIAGGPRRAPAVSPKGAAGSICRCRWCRSAPSAPPAACGNRCPAKTSRSPRRQARFSPISSIVSGNGGNPSAPKKSGSGGGDPEPRRPPAEGIGRRRGLGDKPVRENLTLLDMARRLRPRNAQIEAIWWSLLTDQLNRPGAGPR